MDFSSSGLVAQWLEQRTHNPLVLGSSPSGPTKFHFAALSQMVRGGIFNFRIRLLFFFHEFI